MIRGTKIVKQMLLHTCSSLTMLSRINLPNILHFTLITVQKVDQSFFIAIKSLIYYVSLSGHDTGKILCLINMRGVHLMNKDILISIFICLLLSTEMKKETSTWLLSTWNLFLYIFLILEKNLILIDLLISNEQSFLEISRGHFQSR